MMEGFQFDSEFRQWKLKFKSKRRLRLDILILEYYVKGRVLYFYKQDIQLVICEVLDELFVDYRD